MPDPFRKEYTELTEEQLANVKSIKTVAEQMLETFKYVPKEERSERSRLMNIARTNLEQTVMWAVKAVTTPQLQE